jgi:hypothetical protein
MENKMNKTSNEFNRYGLNRPRPSYIIPDNVRQAIGEGFPAKNHILCTDGVYLKWRRSRWRNVESDLHDAQTRTMYVAIYRETDLLAAVVMRESRNPRHVKMHPDNFFYDCDFASQEMCNHAELVLAARRTLLGGNYYLAPREAFVEISGLFILPEAKGSLAWVEAIHRLWANQYCRGDYSVLVLQALPLEYLHYGDPGGPHNDRLYQRRLRAATHFYRKMLGVQELPEIPSHGVWLARPLPL